jgi:hypothetical protein
MTITDSILDQAYTIYEEWGPKRVIDRAQRIHEEFPSLSEVEIGTTIDQMKAVSKTVWEMSEMGGETRIGRQNVIKLLQKKHPFLQDQGLTHAVFLVNYYAWHEGYDR